MNIANQGSNNDVSISIIVPVYNTQKYLSECLDSVINQTLDDIQIICVNDGSTDNSLEILKKYSTIDKRIIVLDNHHGGLSVTRNSAFAYIKGKYTMFVDSDDWIDANCCEKVWEQAERTQAPITMFFFDGEKGAHKIWGNELWNNISESEKITIKEKEDALEHMIATCKLYLTNFLLDKNILFERGLIFEDILFVWQTVTQASNIAVCKECFYHWRYNESSITGKKWDSRILDVIEIWNKIRYFLIEKNLYENWKDIYIRQKLINIHHWFLECDDIELKLRFKKIALDNLSNDERLSIANADFSQDIILFYTDTKEV
ncbi:MAG: glycosyltransferase [Prevotella sp.]|jgi:glycosyltransferase involved in cell wall biosynthesis|nr:glycosyltransferase [Prevotella sp.]